MEYRKLSDFADFREERTANITFENYISTENMIKDKGGITTASSLPDVKTASAYQPNDILLSNIRPYFCKIWFATQSGSCSSDILVIKAKNNILPRFLYYVLSDYNFFQYDSVTSKGTKMPRGTPKAIMQYLVPDLTIEEQTNISDILFAYDALIENNNKRIKILEQMAENLYKEWFVRFRFPGYESAAFEDGFPKDWDIVKSGTIAAIKSGGDCPGDAVSEPTLECPVPIYSNGIDQKGLYGYTRKAVVCKKSVTISARGTIGYTCLRREPYTPIVRLISVIPHEECFVYWLYYYLKYNPIIGNGTSQQQITIPMVQKKRILVPSQTLIEGFNSKIVPMMDMVDSLTKINKNLTKQRDRLLPRLMSGKLDV